MTDPKKLISLFKRTHWIIQEQTKGLTHDDSLLQLPFRANSMNWVLGHLANSRNSILKTLGEPPALEGTLAARYKRDSEPVTNHQEAVPLKTLLTAIEESQERILAALMQTTPKMMVATYDEENKFTVGDRLEFLHWHETYHVGQIEILRQLAGTNDKII